MYPQRHSMIDWKIIKFKRDDHIDGVICDTTNENHTYESFKTVIKLNEITTKYRSYTRNKITGNWSSSCYWDTQGKHIQSYSVELLNNSYTLLVKEEQWQKYKAETIALIAKINLIDGVFMADIITHMKSLL